VLSTPLPGASYTASTFIIRNIYLQDLVIQFKLPPEIYIYRKLTGKIT
jgi:hypothetical protein